MAKLIEWAERYQIPLYLGAIVLGVVVGLLAPAIAPVAKLAINPLLVLLLFATFLGVPILEMFRGFTDLRFLGVILGLNFIVAPALVYGLSRFIADDQALLIGVLLVLLTPCIDYVIVFTGLAGGASERLLAMTPLLMLAQILLLPIFITWFTGPEIISAVVIGEFITTFLLLIVMPLTGAAVVQLLGRWAPQPARRLFSRQRVARTIESTLAGLMVPLMMATLLAVVASQIAAVGSESTALLRLIPIYLVFAVVMAAIGALAARLAKLATRSARAVIFSAATRNSLVVLPLAMALPAGFELAPLAVVTQTLVELIALVALVWLVPRLAQNP